MRWPWNATWMSARRPIRRAARTTSTGWTGDETYELCAVFARAAPTDPASLRVPPYQEVFWRHAQGDHCFDLEAIDPDARRW